MPDGGITVNRAERNKFGLLKLPFKCWPCKNGKNLRKEYSA
jgi:hypothetical protein